MYPDNLNNQPQGIDYLNQIATPPPAEGFDKKTKIIIAILSFIGLITLIAIFVFSQDSMPSANPSQVASRVNKLLTISKKYNNKFRSTSLQTTNSSLVAVLTTADASMGEALQATGINYKEKQKDILALDPPEKLEKKLDEALLNTQLDITYAHEMNVTNNRYNQHDEKGVQIHQVKKDARMASKNCWRFREYPEADQSNH